MSPEDLLFTEKDGTRSSLQDVVYDGLDNDYSERYPALLNLLREGETPHRLYACIMLAAWGVPEGLTTLTGWARDPGATPWAGSPFTFDRLFGTDASFEMLTWAVQVSQDVDRAEEIAPLRTEAVRALLGIYDKVYFDRTMMLTLDLDGTLVSALQPEIKAAVDRAVSASQNPNIPFDMATQAATLLGILAEFDGEHAASAAAALLQSHPDKGRAVREVAYSLGWGKGPATRAILERLAGAPSASVREDAEASLRRRGGS